MTFLCPHKDQLLLSDTTTPWTRRSKESSTMTWFGASSRAGRPLPIKLLRSEPNPTRHLARPAENLMALGWSSPVHAASRPTDRQRLAAWPPRPAECWPHGGPHQTSRRPPLGPRWPPPTCAPSKSACIQRTSKSETHHPKNAFPECIGMYSDVQPISELHVEA